VPIGSMVKIKSRPMARNPVDALQRFIRPPTAWASTSRLLPQAQARENITRCGEGVPNEMNTIERDRKEMKGVIEGGQALVRVHDTILLRIPR